MAGRTKQSQSEIDGVKYRRAKTWQIILVACNAFTGMSVYTLIGMASYSASVGYGITTAVVGIILTCTRILDGVTDPLVAFLYDKVDTKFGKLRILLVSGFVIEAAALLAMFDFMSSKGFGWAVFTMLYVLYVIGYTITNMTAQTFGAIMTNDPRQRPVIGVWGTAFNYLVPMVLSDRTEYGAAAQVWRGIQPGLFVCGGVGYRYSGSAWNPAGEHWHFRL